MEDLFNTTEEPIEATTEEPIEATTEEPIEATTEEPIDATTKELVDSSFSSSFRRCFKRPPKPRLHAVAISPGDAIQACTVRPNERLSVLSSLDIQQEENMEPLPEFSRDMRHANRRYQKALKYAQDEAERAKKDRKDDNDE